MGGVAIQSNGQSQADDKLNYDAEYDKIIALHDDIVAGRHPRLKVTKKIRSLPTPSPLPVRPNTNGVFKPSTVVPAPSLNGHATSANSQVAPVLKSAAQQASSSAPVASDFDPVLLTKGPALVMAEMARKRRSIESHLRDQCAHKKRFSRQKLLEEERLPDFNVTQVLERAHGIVKPIRFADGKNANRPASTSDSFDENDYYSSQMNSWTTDASPKRQPSSKEDDASYAQPMDVDAVDANEQASSRIQPLSDPVVKKKDDTSAQEARIAELEEQLRLMVEKNVAMQRVATPPREEGLIEEPEYSPPDAPIAHNVQRQSSVTSIDHDQSRETAPRRSSRPLQPQSREYAAARNESAPSPVQNDMRIVRNHITSPLAPQPARVSPLAVAKAPPGTQMRETQQNEARSLRGAGSEKNGRNSPNQPLQPLTSRKRRRGKGSGEMGRNVVARRENNSPEVRIKEEPVSPQPRAIALEAWRPPRTEEVRRPVYVDTVSPQRRAAGHAAAGPSRSERLAQQSFAGDTGRPLTPVERRNAQHAQLIEINDEPDLRRVVSTRQMYMPSGGSESRPYRASVQPHQSSQFYPEHPSSPTPRNPQRAPSRVGSIAMTGPQPRIVVDQYGNRFVEAPAPPERQMSVVPIARPIDHEHFYEQPRRPIIIRRPSYEMGHDDRHYVQKAPSPTSPRYVQRMPSPTSVRYVQRAPSPTSPRYVQRAASPTSPQYVQHPSSPPPSHFAQPVNEIRDRYADEPYAPRGEHVRVVSQADNQGIARFEDFARPREPVTRLQSVRPVSQYEVPRMPSVRPGQDRVVSMRPMHPPYEGSRIHSMQPEQERTRPMTSQYELPREQYGRVQSVRPEQERIVSLGGGRDMVQRQVSVRPEEVYVRPAGAVVEDRPRYSYIPEPQDRRFVENDGLGNRMVYETPGSGLRRPMQ